MSGPRVFLLSLTAGLALSAAVTAQLPEELKSAEQQLVAQKAAELKAAQQKAAEQRAADQRVLVVRIQRMSPEQKIQLLKEQNALLLQKQAASLQRLEELLKQSEQLKTFSRRG